MYVFIPHAQPCIVPELMACPLLSVHQPPMRSLCCVSASHMFYSANVTSMCTSNRLRVLVCYSLFLTFFSRLHLPIPWLTFALFLSSSDSAHAVCAHSVLSFSFNLFRMCRSNLSSSVILEQRSSIPGHSQLSPLKQPLLCHLDCRHASAVSSLSPVLLMPSLSDSSHVSAVLPSVSYAAYISSLSMQRVWLELTSLITAVRRRLYFQVSIPLSYALQYGLILSHTPCTSLHAVSLIASRSMLFFLSSLAAEFLSQFLFGGGNISVLSYCTILY